MIRAEKWQNPNIYFFFLHSCICSELQAPQQCGQIGFCFPCICKTESNQIQDAADTEALSKQLQKA